MNRAIPARRSAVAGWPGGRPALRPILTPDRPLGPAEAVASEDASQRARAGSSGLTRADPGRQGRVARDAVIA